MRAAAVAEAGGVDGCGSGGHSWCNIAPDEGPIGGLGVVRGSVVERLYRDARLYPIGGGTREIMNEIISKAERY